MDFENYLIESKSTILSVTRICKVINEILNSCYWDIIKGKKVKKEILDEILSLNKAILSIMYCARCERNEYYKHLDSSYNDNFEYNDIINKD